MCVCGPAGSGKTTLVERLIPRLTRAGLHVGAVKHSLHLEPGSAGKDHARFARSGADPAIVSARDGAVVFGHRRESTLLDLVADYCKGCDMVLAEGYQQSVHDKIRVVHGYIPQSNSPVPSVRLTVGDLPERDYSADDLDAISQWVMAWLDRRRSLRGSLIGAVMAGGRSTRMGADKAAVVVRGASMLARLSVMLADWLGRAWVIGRRIDVPDVPACIPWHLDVLPGVGPMGGIATTLRLASIMNEGCGVCVLACDMPAFNGDLLEYLLMGRKPSSPATVMVNPAGGHIEPLAGIYETSAFAPLVRAVQARQLSPSRWLEDVGAYKLDVPPDLADRLANFNTPQDLESLIARFPED